MLAAVITIMRLQKYLLLGYRIAAAFALALSNYVVKMYEMKGVAILYTVLMGSLCVSFGAVFIVGILAKRIREIRSYFALAK